MSRSFTPFASAVARRTPPVAAWAASLALACAAGLALADIKLPEWRPPNEVRALVGGERLPTEAVEAAFASGALALDGQQVGSWAGAPEPLPLGALEGVAPPCHDLRVGDGARALAVVCPDDTGAERLVVVQQGIVLRLRTPLVPGARPSLSDDGHRIAARFLDDDGDDDDGGGGVLRVLDLARTREHRLTGLDDPRHPALSGDGQWLACSARDGKGRAAAVVPLDGDGATLARPALYGLAVDAVSGDGTRVVVHGGLRGGDVVLLDLERGRSVAVTEDEGAAISADLSTHGGTVIYAARYGGATGLFTADVNARKVVNRVGFFHPLRDVQISADGRRLAFVAESGDAEGQVWDTAGRDSVEVQRMPSGCGELALSADGGWAALLCADAGQPGARIELVELPARR